MSACLAFIKLLASIYGIGKCITTYSTTDFLINYQGGFVRRGLVGEIVYQIRALTGLDPRIFFISLTIISLAFLIYILIINFRKLHLCWWILPLNVCFMGAFPMRKDYLCMALVALALINLYTASSKITKILIFNVIISIAILIHESVFFIIVPLGTLLLWNIDKSPTCFFKKILYILPIYATFFLTVIFKGDSETALTIHRSWNIAELGDTPVATIEALGKTTEYFINFHIEKNFLTKSCHLYGFITKPLIWIAIFLLIPNILFINKKINKTEQSSESFNFVSILFFQFCSLFPMLTILSCDQSRICFYWTITSLLIFFYVPASAISEILPYWYKKLISSIYQVIFKKYNKAIACVLLMVTAITPAGTSVPNALKCSLLGNFYRAHHLILTPFRDAHQSKTTPNTYTGQPTVPGYTTQEADKAPHQN